jgi:tetratricopeptide (TPR) repeat protein
MKMNSIFVMLIIVLPGYAQIQESADSHFEEAIRLQNSERHADAISQLNKCLFLKPDYIDAYTARAASKERLKDLQGALTDLNTSLELLPDQYEVLLSRGSLLFRMGRYADAKADFIKLLALPSGETNTIYYRRSAHSEGTDRIMTAQGSSRSQLFNYLGLIELQLANLKQSIIHLDSAIALSPDDADFYVNRALAKQANNDPASADDYRTALTIYPDNALAKHNLAVLSATKGSFAETEKKLTAVIESDSTLYYPYVERGYYRYLSGNFSGALNDYNHALFLNNSDPEVWLSRGLVKEKLHNLKGAYSDYVQAIELKEDFLKAWLNRGNVLMKQERYKDALEDYTSALAYQPDYGHAYFNRAIAYYKLRRYKDACADLQKAQQLGISVDEKMKKSICK